MFPLLTLTTAILTNLAQVADCVNNDETNRLFDMTATVSFIGNECDRSYGIGLRNAAQDCIIVLDGTKTTIPTLKPGDSIRVRGHTKQSDEYKNTFALPKSIEILGHGTPPAPISISAQELFSGSFNQKYIAIRGTVIDTFRDEIDTRIYFVVINSRRRSVYAYFYSTDDITEWLSTLVNAEIEIRGLCTKGDNCIRQLTGNILTACRTNNISVIRQPSDLFSIAATEDRQRLTSPDDILQLDHHRIVGKVIATWQPSHALLKRKNGSTSVVEMSANQPLPRNGQFIESVGFAETDLYSVNLSHAIWRPAAPFPLKEEPTTDVTASVLLTDSNGRFLIDPSFHGKNIRLAGTVKSLSLARTFRIENSGLELNVDASANPQALERLSVGCRVSVTGTCVMDVGSWRPYATFPRVSGYTLVIRQPADLSILSRPPWWTVSRLLCVLCIITGILVGIVIWNRFLRRLVERRSRQLAKERMARDRAEVRADERTRLSVELHDTIAQNLSGIALQLDAVQLAAEDEPEILFDSIRTAQQSLSSCRQNLRYCLWDLRSRAFEEKSLSDALTRTLKPHQGRTTISIDCPIGTRGMSDNAIHAVLCIIRELVINAIRHGKASRISISGREEHDTMDFSITDNGSGFDPNTAPGITEGHFGLQGVRERVHQLKGILKISSHLGTGTSVTIHGLLKNI